MITQTHKPSTSFFVYQNWTDEKLYKSGLTQREAYEAFDELDRLIESGSCGDGCATLGNTFDPGDYYVCLRLGLVPDCTPEL